MHAWCSDTNRVYKTKQMLKRSFDYAPTIFLWWTVLGSHLKISVTQDFLPEILNQENITIFISCSIKSVRVGPKNLGSVGLPEAHTFYILALLVWAKAQEIVTFFIFSFWIVFNSLSRLFDSFWTELVK